MWLLFYNNMRYVAYGKETIYFRIDRRRTEMDQSLKNENQKKYLEKKYLMKPKFQTESDVDKMTVLKEW